MGGIKEEAQSQNGFAINKYRDVEEGTTFYDFVDLFSHERRERKTRGCPLTPIPQVVSLPVGGHYRSVLRRSTKRREEALHIERELRAVVAVPDWRKQRRMWMTITSQ